MKYLVIAENYRQALDWSNQNKDYLYAEGIIQPGELMYLDSVENLKGMYNPSGIFVGTYWKRPDIDKLFIALFQSIVDNPEKYIKVKEAYEYKCKMIEGEYWKKPIQYDPQSMLKHHNPVSIFGSP